MRFVLVALVVVGCDDGEDIGGSVDHGGLVEVVDVDCANQPIPGSVLIDDLADGLPAIIQLEVCDYDDSGVCSRVGGAGFTSVVDIKTSEIGAWIDLSSCEDWDSIRALIIR